MTSAAPRLGGVAALGVLAVVAAGCGGGSTTHSSSVLAASRSGWAGGTQLGNHGVLGACATATSHHRLLIVCRSPSTAAFSKTCWSAPDQKSIAGGAWEDASTDPACNAAQLAAEKAGLFGH